VQPDRPNIQPELPPITLPPTTTTTLADIQTLPPQPPPTLNQLPPITLRPEAPPTTLAHQPPLDGPGLPESDIAFDNGSLHIPITPFANMERGYQATNPGFRAVLKDQSGRVIAAGPMTMDAVINGKSGDAARGVAYGRLVLNVPLEYVGTQIQAGRSGEGQGTLSICMAEDQAAPFEQTKCRRLSSGGIGDSSRPFQYFDRGVTYSISRDNQITISRFSGNFGDGDSPHQAALSVYHPAFAFAAPGRAFKDFQSPLVLDLSGTGNLDLIDVWDDTYQVHFDLDGDGRKVRTGWIGANAGLLVLDVGGKGTISSGRQLFGEFSAVVGKPTAAGEQTFDNGFLALAQYDDSGNRRIDENDDVYSKLRVWRDLNHDGISQESELFTLEELGIVAINLHYERRAPEGQAELVADNEVRLFSTYETKDGKQHKIADVWFKVRRFIDFAQTP